VGAVKVLGSPYVFGFTGFIYDLILPSR